MRLAHARRLLQSSFLSVKQVMAACGWNDPSHFCREFKRQYGYSPTALRVSTARLAGAIDPVERRAAG